MGNCQAVDAAALVIQHPNGKQERMYCSIPASEVMKMNPGHYVSLIIPLPIVSDGDKQNINSDDNNNNNSIRFTRVKLLRATDTLVLGRAYRLVTTQEVMKVLRAKKHAKITKETQSDENLEINQEKVSNSSQTQTGKIVRDKNDQAVRSERPHRRSGSTNSSSGRPKSWRPSLNSISESGSSDGRRNTASSSVTERKGC